MAERLEFQGGHLAVDSGNFFFREFAGENHAGETDAAEKPCPSGVADVALGARVKVDRRNIHPQHGHILHYQSVDSGAVKLADEFLYIGNLVVENNGVDGSVDAGVVAVCHFHHPGNIGDGF